MTFLTTQLMELYFETDCEELFPIILKRLAREKQRAIEAPLVPTTRFSLDNCSEAQFKAIFRFERHDISRLAATLRIPAVVIAPNRSRATGIEALCIMLRKLAYPCRWVDLERLFGRREAELSSIYNWMIRDIYERFKATIAFDEDRLTPERMAAYAQAIQGKGAPLDRCWGFIDGTVRPICRPTRMQRHVFNGHKRVHALKYQSVVCPDGIIVHMSKPLEGKRHDSRLLRESGLLEILTRCANDAHGQPFYLYGDPAYPLSIYLLAPYRGSRLTPEQAEFNKRMSSVRESVEWGFQRILALWAGVDFKKNQKLYLQLVGTTYLVAALLTNCHSCLYGSEISEFFDMASPSLEAYLRYQ
jgi:nuclease HARBI1